MLKKLKRWASTAKAATTLLALWRLFKHPRTPKLARWVAVAVVAYAASPIDLIPDFIPVLGMLDDLLIIPAGVALVVRLVPPALWQECMEAAAADKQRSKPRLWWGAAFIVLLWALALWGVWMIVASRPLL
jgi:uncharacterized membrane protein YkvA (DUF1232 family)